MDHRGTLPFALLAASAIVAACDGAGPPPRTEADLSEANRPAYAALSRHHGLRVPIAYFEFVTLARELSPGDPALAFEPLGFIWDEPGDDEDARWPGDDGRYVGTPAELVVFGRSGTDGGHFGFLVDDETATRGEYPIVEVYPRSEITIVGATFAEFVGYLVVTEREVYAAEGESPPPELDRLANLVERRLGVAIPAGRQEALDRAKRCRAGTVPTEDGLGIVLPAAGVDADYLADLDWPDSAPDPSRLDEAERRLEDGEPGTALVLARNFRHLYWYDDWDRGRQFIRRTASILSAAYRALGRDRAAARVRAVTDWAVEHVR